LFSGSARLHSDRERESGFYTGKIEAVDFGTNKYWVTFDRPGIGKHLIHDTEIKVYTYVLYYVIFNYPANLMRPKKKSLS